MRSNATELRKGIKYSTRWDLFAKPLHALGIDSLAAVELRTWMLKRLDADVAVFGLMEVPSVCALAGLIAPRSSFLKSNEADE